MKKKSKKPLPSLLPELVGLGREEQRVIVWVSAGIASAVAWKLAVNKYGKRAIGVYCDVSSTEHPDNIPFLNLVAKWVGQPLIILKSDEFNSIDEVFEKRQYLAGTKGAPCTVQMKKIPRFKFQRADDIHIFGLSYDEPKRINDFVEKNPDMILDWILRDNKVTKHDCMVMTSTAGLPTPTRYLQGYENNNCICCVKASSVQYWVMERRNNPEVFKRRCDQSRKFGARLVRYKLPGMKKAERIFLDQLPLDKDIRLYGKPIKIVRSTENVSCGPECGG